MPVLNRGLRYFREAALKTGYFVPLGFSGQPNATIWELETKRSLGTHKTRVWDNFASTPLPRAPLDAVYQRDRSMALSVPSIYIVLVPGLSWKKPAHRDLGSTIKIALRVYLGKANIRSPVPDQTTTKAVLRARHGNDS